MATGSDLVDELAFDNLVLSEDVCMPLDYETVVRSAAFATECGMGAFLRGAWNKLDVAAQFGPFPWTALPVNNALVNQLATLKAGQIWIVDDVASLRGASGADSEYAPAYGSIRFLTGAPVFNAGGLALGALVIADVGPRAGLRCLVPG